MPTAAVCLCLSVRDFRRHNKYTMRSVDRAPLDIEKVCVCVWGRGPEMQLLLRVGCWQSTYTALPRPCRAVHLLLAVLPALLLPQLMAGMPLKPEDVSYSPYETLVRDRGV